MRQPLEEGAHGGHSPWDELWAPSCDIGVPPLTSFLDPGQPGHLCLPSANSIVHGKCSVFAVALAHGALPTEEGDAFFKDLEVVFNEKLYESNLEHQGQKRVSHESHINDMSSINPGSLEWERIQEKFRVDKKNI